MLGLGNLQREAGRTLMGSRAELSRGNQGGQRYGPLTLTIRARTFMSEAQLGKNGHKQMKLLTWYQYHLRWCQSSSQARFYVDTVSSTWRSLKYYVGDAAPDAKSVTLAQESVIPERFTRHSLEVFTSTCIHGKT